MAMHHSVCDIKRLSVGSLRREDNVRFGSKADISECPANVRFTPESGHGDFSHLGGRPAKGAGGSVVPHTLAELFPF